MIINVFLDNTAEVTRLLVMMRALIEANRVQGTLATVEPFTHSLLGSAKPYHLQMSVVFFLCILKAGEFRDLGK